MARALRRHPGVALAAGLVLLLVGTGVAAEVLVGGDGATDDALVQVPVDRPDPSPGGRGPTPDCTGEAAPDKCDADGTTVAPLPPTSAAPGPIATAGPTGPPADDGGRAGFPNAATTGVPAGWQPAAVHAGDLWVREPGTVVADLHVTGSIQVRAHDVTIRDTKVDGVIWNQENDSVQYGGLLIEDTEVGPDTGVLEWADAAVGTSGYTARRVEIHGVTDGFRISGDDVRIEDSFVRLSEIPGSCAHLDGVQGYGGGERVVVHHNTIDARGSCSTSAVFMASASPHIDLQDNLLLGGAYSIHLNQLEVPTHFVVRGNRVVDGSYDHGPSEVLDSGALTLSCGDNRLVTIDEDYQVTAELGEIPC